MAKRAIVVVQHGEDLDADPRAEERLQQGRDELEVVIDKEIVAHALHYA